MTLVQSPVNRTKRPPSVFQENVLVRCPRRTKFVRKYWFIVCVKGSAPNLLQDVKTGQLPYGAPHAGQSLLFRDGEGAQVEGRAGDCRGTIELKDGRLQHHAVSNPLVAELGKKHTARCCAVCRPLIGRSLRNMQV